MGSGKSTLSEVFRSNGITVIDADTIAKDVMQNDTELQAQLSTLLGKESYSDGNLNTTFIANKIFTDPKLKQDVEALVHPRTLRVIEKHFADAKPGEIIALESAIILQTGLDEILDIVILVTADDDEILHRLTVNRKNSEEDIRSRLLAQGYEDIRTDDADLVITNDTSLDEFIKRCSLTLELVKISAMQNLSDTPLRTVFDAEETIHRG